MNCPESHEMLQRRLDGLAAVPSAALEGHLAACAECRERHAAAQRLAEAIRRCDQPVPPPHLAPRIVARVLAEQRARRAWVRRAWTGAVVAAGLLLAALALAFWAGLGPQRLNPDEQGPLIHKAPPPEKKAVGQNPDRAPLLDQALDEAREAALALTRKTAGETLAQARRWLAPANPLSVPGLGNGPGLAPVLDPPAQTFREAGKSVTTGLKPVARSARRAVDLFLREVTPAGLGQ
jgi:hypothetical protein